MAKIGESHDGLIQNPWRWNESRNPYLHNIFTLLGLDDPNVSSEEFNERVERLDQQLALHIERKVFGYTPTDTDLATAQALQKDTNRLTIERLLVHRVHLLETQQFEEYSRTFAQTDPGRAQDVLPLPVVNVAPIARRLPAPTRIGTSLVQAPDLAPILSLLAADRRQEWVLPW
jgi:hypothetical protein